MTLQIYDITIQRYDITNSIVWQYKYMTLQFKYMTIPMGWADVVGGVARTAEDKRARRRPCITKPDGCRPVRFLIYIYWESVLVSPFLYLHDQFDDTGLNDQFGDASRSQTDVDRNVLIDSCITQPKALPGRTSLWFLVQSWSCDSFQETRD